MIKTISACDLLPRDVFILPGFEPAVVCIVISKPEHVIDSDELIQVGLISSRAAYSGLTYLFSWYRLQVKRLE